MPKIRMDQSLSFTTGRRKGVQVIRGIWESVVERQGKQFCYSVNKDTILNMFVKCPRNH